MAPIFGQGAEAVQTPGRLRPKLASPEATFVHKIPEIRAGAKTERAYGVPTCSFLLSNGAAAIASLNHGSNAEALCV